jgi:hypothetical protein
VQNHFLSNTIATSVACVPLAQLWTGSWW